MKQICKVFHVEFNEPVEVDGILKKDFYFGSKAAVFDTFRPSDIGITLESLRSHIDLKKAPYRNSKVSICLGEFQRKQTNRGKRVKYSGE
nr:hypothetical protein [Parabacteroides goldsteinii]